jgi:drug/metabolite transporter (DMT)-like permease
MSTTAFLLTLLAAILHAAWNLVVKTSDDRLVSALAVTWGAAVVSLPVLVFAGPPSADVLPYLLPSSLVHTTYLISLAKAYERADFALSYPLARGMAPLLVSVGGVVFANDMLPLLGIVGVALVAGGILSLVHMPRPGQHIDAALVTGLCIAAYTVIDGTAVRATGDSLRYLAALFLLQAVVLTGVVLLLRRGRFEAGAGQWQTVLIGGGASALAYLLVLIASQEAPLGLVSGVRELSVVFGVVAGAHLLGEHVSRRHAVSVATAVFGAILIGLT